MHAQYNNHGPGMITRTYIRVIRHKAVLKPYTVTSANSARELKNADGYCACLTFEEEMFPVRGNVPDCPWMGTKGKAPAKFQWQNFPGGPGGEAPEALSFEKC